MTRIERITADFIRADPPNPRHPRSILSCSFALHFPSQEWLYERQSRS